MPERKPTRRWFRFSLRTMLVLVTLVCAVSGYVGWAMNWKRQREAFLTRPGIYAPSGYGRIIRSPAVLRPLGEDGMEFVILDTDYHDKSEYEQAKRLFPEAVVLFSPDDREGP